MTQKRGSGDTDFLDYRILFASDYRGHFSEIFGVTNAQPCRGKVTPPPATEMGHFWVTIGSHGISL